MVAALILYSVSGIICVLSIAGMWHHARDEDASSKGRRGEMMLTGIGLLLVAAFIAWIAGRVW